MQIVAHSVVPPNPLPYLHLGYVSATSPLGSSFLLFTGCCILISAYIARRVRSARARRLTPVCLVLGVFLVIFSFFAPDPQRHQTRASHTRSRITQLVLCIERNRAGKEPTPHSLEEMRQAWGLEEKDTIDGWSHPLRVQTKKEGKHLRYTVTSAGPDEIFDTEDDITKSTKDPQVAEKARRP